LTYRGTIKNWLAPRAFGFITPIGGGKDIFVHVSELHGIPHPTVGMLVQYDIGEGRAGKPMATNVTPLNDDKQVEIEIAWLQHQGPVKPDDVRY
jgi:CspA family cold shock protein